MKITAVALYVLLVLAAGMADENLGPSDARIGRKTLAGLSQAPSPEPSPTVVKVIGGNIGMSSLCKTYLLLLWVAAG